MKRFLGAIPTPIVHGVSSVAAVAAVRRGTSLSSRSFPAPLTWAARILAWANSVVHGRTRRLSAATRIPIRLARSRPASAAPPPPQPTLWHLASQPPHRSLSSSQRWLSTKTQQLYATKVNNKLSSSSFTVTRRVAPCLKDQILLATSQHKMATPGGGDICAQHGNTTDLPPSDDNSLVNLNTVRDVI